MSNKFNDIIYNELSEEGEYLLKFCGKSWSDIYEINGELFINIDGERVRLPSFEDKVNLT